MYTFLTFSAIKKKKKYQINNLEIYKVQKEQKYLAVKVTSMHMFSVLWLLVKWYVFILIVLELKPYPELLLLFCDTV